MGVSKTYGTADCAVFGFKYRKDVPLLLEPTQLQTMYVASPTKLELKELAALSGTDDIEKKEEEIQGWIKEHHWDDLREDHWKAIENKVNTREKNMKAKRDSVT